MDHARKIGKTDKPIAWSHKPSLASSTCRGKATSVDEETMEDSRLVNWRKWLKDREKHYRRYEKLCARERDHLLMIKDLDDFRRKDEQAMESILGNARDRSMIFTMDKRHRVPAFWLTPEMLPKRGHPDWPDIPITLTSESTTERVALPELIKREKGLIISREQRVSQRRRIDHWTEAAEKNMSRRMQRLRAGELDMEQLAIKGEKWERKPRKRVAKIRAASFESLRTIKSDDASQSEVIEYDRDIILVIQGRKVSLEEADKHLSWSLIFKSTGHRVCEREIRFENRGNCAVIYRWRYENQADTNFPPPSPRNSPFFFNKNKGLVLPGQMVKLLVWFRSYVPRVATESWTLKTEPPICQEFLTFRFWGIATLFTNLDASMRQTTSANSSRCERIEKYLDRRIRDVKIHEIMKSIVESVHHKVFPAAVPYGGFFLERELFVAKNPTYFWHSELIRELRLIYDEATSDDSPSWSLSLTDLRTILLKIKAPQVRSESLLRFNQLARDLLRPSLLETIGFYEESMAYNLLCSFANKFEEESDYIANKCFLLVETSNERISSEAHGDISRSTSISSLSLSTPRKKSRKKSVFGQSKSTSKTSLSMSTNNLNIAQNAWHEKAAKSCFLYKEVFHVTIREILSSTIMSICAVVDSNNNFNRPKK